MGLSIISLIIPLFLGYGLNKLVNYCILRIILKKELKDIPREVDLIEASKNVWVNFEYNYRYTSTPIDLDLESIINHSTISSGLYNINILQKYYLELYIQYYIKRYPIYKDVYSWGKEDYNKLSSFIEGLREHIEIWQRRR